MAENSSSTTTSALPPPPPPATLIPDLPDDVALQCLARIPRSHHPILSLVSKSWYSTFRSQHLFITRTLLNCTQQFLYLNLRINTSFNWYLLYETPNKRRTLTPLPPIPSHPIGSAYAVFASKIYVIGGSVNQIPSNRIWVFDTQINRWEMGPRMRVCREFAAAGAVNGKIYVMGGCVVDSWARSTYWAEVFDPLEGSWNAVPCSIELRDKWMHASAVIYGKVYAMADRGGVVYDVVSGEWGDVSNELDMGWRGRAAVVDGVLYCYDYLGRIRGYDVLKDEWKDLKGLEKGLPKFLCGATMANLGGRLCVVWEGKGNGKEMEVICAEIEVAKDGSGDLCGSILWSDVILVAPSRSSVVHCAAVGL